MPSRARRLTESDEAIWANYTRQLLPLRGRAARKPGQPSPTKPDDSAPAAVAPRLSPKATVPKVPGAKGIPNAACLRSNAAPLAVGSPSGGIDKATWHRFQSGKLPTARTLDLHGMTAQRAYHALVSFLRTAHAEQVRCVEVVTGRGTGEAGGVIRRELPHWLNLPEIRPLILGAAHPHALNPGSVRLILRRIR
jgi:DNA-nicking Smr family endonuclease